MRLTEREHNAIVAVLKRHFGDDAVIWLFGSRVDDRFFADWRESEATLGRGGIEKRR
ncbi:hypothetical protein ACFFU2_09930 [Halomonas alkalicola]|uniref:Nucleotidyltransferase domain-containing protein n=1 Tax=Halomonas alkalicola TaxID=1930622 RepID=A0ABY9H3G2_9GAMM|nr:hypothetical protein [Halomonas alkalicola]WLI72939.1 hypothetical protein B6N23_14435 [Halomonas alkalicola]